MTAWDCLHFARLRVTRARIGGANQRHAHVHVHRMFAAAQTKTTRSHDSELRSHQGTAGRPGPWATWSGG